MRREESSNFLAFLFSLLIFLFVRDVQARKLQQIQCSTSSCGDIKNISNPFRLKGDPAGCGDPKFELSCSPSNKTILEIHSGKYYVKRISYDDSIITVVDVNLANGSCGLPQQSLSDHVLREEYKDNRYYVYGNITYANFVRCSSKILHPTYRKLPCLNIGNQSDVYVTYPSNLTVGNLLESCSFISVVPVNASVGDNPSYETIQKLLAQSGFDLHWCENCGSTDKTIYIILLWILSLSASYLLRFMCSLLELFLLLVSYYPSFIAMFLTDNAFRRLSVDLFIVISSFIVEFAVILIARLILVIILVVFLIHKYKKTKITVDNVEKFLYNQQSWMPKRYSFIEIIAITNHFGDKLGQGGFGSVYKGQLLNGTLVAVKVLANSKFSGEEFINEVSTISRIHHTNVVRFLGFCSKGSKQALVYKYMPNGSLDKHIFSKKGNDQAFRWERLHEIALGTAHGIEYLHNGCDVCILYFDIKPHNILLDQNFIPKVADFSLAKFHPKENDFICMSATRGTIGYIAPKVYSINFGIVSCK